ncbi:MAG: hypothetical protein H6P98_3053, partial [Candidatus Aminicenantes bacterium]|nr:hypothetical protein [Candidatus Aminicenantes bacterium]
MSVAWLGLSLMLCFLQGNVPRAADVAASLNAAAGSQEGRIPPGGPAETQAAPAGEGQATDEKKSEAPQEKEGDREKPTQPQVETWGDFTPGEGFLIGRSKLGELAISGYALVRYINQMPAGQTFTDHLGNEHPVDARHDIWSHRIMVFFMGWLGSPKLIYNMFLWTVNTTDQKAIFATLGYQFSKKFSLYAGILGNPGTRSIMGSHPYWLAPDRVMADEFFRPYFTMALTAQGELVPGLWWNATVGDNNSILGTKATELDRKFTVGGNVWWMP